MKRYKITDVFTPTAFPKHTYVERSGEYEERLEQEIETPGRIVHLSGPSKCGKTVLCKKIIGNKMLNISGSSIKSSADLWNSLINKLRLPESKSESTDKATEYGFDGSGEVNFGVFKAGSGSNLNRSVSKGNHFTYNLAHREEAINVLTKKELVLVIDDFHYVPREAQIQIAKEIKELQEEEIKIVLISIPHRSGDMIRSNPELSGRVSAISIEPWQTEELKQIPYKGFPLLNLIYDEDSDSIDKLADESFTSPQLMQELCLQLCRQLEYKYTLESSWNIDDEDVDWDKLYRRVGQNSNMIDVYERFRNGQTPRGTPRLKYNLKSTINSPNTREVDIYGCVLIAISRLIQHNKSSTISYDDILNEMPQIVIESEPPRGVNIINTLGRIYEIDMNSGASPVLDWDEEHRKLVIVNPYFLYYLRSIQLG